MPATALRTLVPAAAVWAAIAVLTYGGGLLRPELLGFDLLSRLTTPARFDAPIVIVGIDEPSFAELGRQWPWPRGLHGKLIDRLKAAGAAVIGLDILFADPSSPEEDERLAQAIRRAGKVVLASDIAVQDTGQYHMTMRVEPLPRLLQAGARPGLAGVTPGPDQVVRRLPQAGDSFWSQVVASLDRRRARPGRGTLVRYYGADHRFRYVSYYQALDPDRFLPPGALAGKIVLVGHDTKVAPGKEAVDAYATPYSAATGRLTPGVELHATFVADALNNSAIRQAAMPWSLALTGLALLVASAPARDWHPRRGALVSLGSMAGVAALSLGLFAGLDLWLPVVGTLVAVAMLYVVQVAQGFLRERVQRRRLRAMFARYVSPNRVAYLVAHPESLALGGVRRECSFVFTDLAGFTGLMEGLGPEPAVTLLNAYLDRMIAIAFEHEGTLDRVVGDAVAILFSAPVEQPDHRRRALACALDMARFSERYAAEAREGGVPFGITRVGVHTGMVTVGNFGGKTMFDYRALGDPVNTASRLERVNKHLGTRICVSGETLSGWPGMPARPVGRLLLKGKTQAVLAYEPLPAGDDADYAAAYGALDGDPAEALRLFTALAADRPEDGLVRFHLRRLEAGQVGSLIAFAEK